MTGRMGLMDGMRVPAARSFLVIELYLNFHDLFFKAISTYPYQNVPLSK